MEWNAKFSPWNLDTKAKENPKLQAPNGSDEGLFDSFESHQHDSIVKKETVESEPLLALKLGKRSYFEDMSPVTPPILTMEKKHKSNDQNTQCSSCQVEGCGLDLASAKDYYRKQRVCESHSKSPKVVISGLERRFCQQCSRFHSLEEFDEKKRSCRRRLSHHNARRRKSHCQADQLNQPALSSSHSDGSQQTSPFASPSTAMNLAWQNIPETKEFLLKPAKANSEIPGIIPMITDYPNLHFASKVLPTNSTNPDTEDSIITSSDPNATQDFHPALSLLSTNSRDSYETKSISVEHSNHTNGTSQPITHAMSQLMPLAQLEYWPTDHDQQVNANMWSSYFENFQLPEEPDESRFLRLD